MKNKENSNQMAINLKEILQKVKFGVRVLLEKNETSQ
jgi:hypothetical protein